RHIQTRDGNRRAGAAPHGVFPCAGEDRWCAITVFGDGEWTAFCKAIGDPAWTRDARFCDSTARKAHESELEEYVADWTRVRTAEEVMETLQQAGVAAGVVETAREVMDVDPQLRARGWHIPIEHPVLGVMGHPVPPYRLLGTAAQVGTAPLIGEHNFMICTDLLGISVDEFVELE